MRGDVFASRRRAGAAAAAVCLATSVLDGVAAEAACRGGSGRAESPGVAGAFGEPGAQHRDGGRGSAGWPAACGLCRGSATCGAGAEVDVAAVQAGELGDAQPGLDGEQQQGVVAAADPRCAGRVRRAARRSPARVRKRDDRRGRSVSAGSPARAAMSGGVLGVAQGGVAEQRADRGQADVAGPGAVVPLGLEVVEERRDQRWRRGRARSSCGGLLAGPLLRRRRAAAGRCRGRRRWCAGWPGAAGSSRSVKNACSVGASAVMAGLRPCGVLPARRPAASSSGAADRYQ